MLRVFVSFASLFSFCFLRGSLYIIVCSTIYPLLIYEVMGVSLTVMLSLTLNLLPSFLWAHSYSFVQSLGLLLLAHGAISLLCLLFTYHHPYRLARDTLYYKPTVSLLLNEGSCNV